MSLRDWLLPDEVQSAAQAAGHMLSVVRETSHFWLKHSVASAVPFAFGTAIAWLLLPSQIDPTKVGALKDVVTGILTFVAVLAGFMVTLMLFTGRTDGTQSLTVDSAPHYVRKVTYLLFSQALTLGYHIACILMCIGWLIAQSAAVSAAASKWLLLASFGMLALSMFRAMLLPFQIYEVHDFELSAMVSEKNSAFARQLSSERGAGVDPIPRQ